MTPTCFKKLVNDKRSSLFCFKKTQKFYYNNTQDKTLLKSSVNKLALSIDNTVTNAPAYYAPMLSTALKCGFIVEFLQQKNEYIKNISPGVRIPCFSISAYFSLDKCYECFWKRIRRGRLITFLR